MKILNDNGSYLCISLLQDHILREILNYFIKQKCIINIHEVLIKNSKFFPFLVNIVKIKENEIFDDKIKLFIKGEDKPYELNINECLKKIKDLQLMTYFMTDVKKFRQGQRFTIDIWDSNNKDSNIPKYTLHIVDSQESKILTQAIIYIITLSFNTFNRRHAVVSSLLKGRNQDGFSLLNLEILISFHSTYYILH